MTEVTATNAPGIRSSGTPILRVLFTFTVIVSFVSVSILQVEPEFVVHYWNAVKRLRDQQNFEIPAIPFTPPRFTPVRGKGIFTFHNVCIEDKKIVVYNSSETKEEKFIVSTSKEVRVPARFWDISFTTEPFDASNASSIYNTAFFLIPNCPGNLFHFWHATFVNFLSTVKMSQSLESSEPVHVLYRYEWRTLEDQSCWNAKRYSTLMQTANVADDDDWFGDIPSGTCYKNAVFGSWSGANGINSSFAINHVLTQLGLSRNQCSQYTITLLNRNKRRILNMDTLVESLKHAGYNNTKVVNFGGLSIREQVETAMCSSVFIGISGAGLQWFMFMKPGSTLVEIAWPKQDWVFFYRAQVKAYDVKSVSLEATDVHLNWTSYETEVRKGVKVSDEERERLSSRGPLKKPADNHWKWADVNVDPAKLLEALI